MLLLFQIVLEKLRFISWGTKRGLWNVVLGTPRWFHMKVIDVVSYPDAIFVNIYIYIYINIYNILNISIYENEYLCLCIYACKFVSIYLLSFMIVFLLKLVSWSSFQSISFIMNVYHVKPKKIVYGKFFHVLVIFWEFISTEDF